MQQKCASRKSHCVIRLQLIYRRVSWGGCGFGRMGCASTSTAPYGGNLRFSFILTFDAVCLLCPKFRVHLAMLFLFCSPAFLVIDPWRGWALASGCISCHWLPRLYYRCHQISLKSSHFFPDESFHTLCSVGGYATSSNHRWYENFFALYLYAFTCHASITQFYHLQAHACKHAS